MPLEQGLVAHLTADAGVSALVGTRVFPERRHQGSALPCLVYQRVSSLRDVDMDGPSDFVQVRFRVDCWASSYSVAKGLADAVRSALNGVGLASPRTLGSEPVQLVYLDSDSDLGEFEGDTSEYRVTQDWMVIHTET